ncbi:hypothetical protein ACFQ07_03290 [Actinomadura adrarensis]|uniref:XRE family transcriptional regulator n=1 Tax=Actinomadura adrarensis TaxID=1819600 RepID=A0ABW3CC66_9ACTN
MGVDQQELQNVLDQVFAREDTLEACRRRDLGAIITILRKYGVTQGQIAARTDIGQGRLSEYKTGKRVAEETAVFERFATGLDMPSRARQAMGLAPRPQDANASVDSHEDPDIPRDPYEIQLLAGAVGKIRGNVSRRKVLGLAATVGGAATIGGTDVWDRLSYAISKPVAVDEAIVNEIENRSAGFHQLDMVLPGPGLYKSIMAHLGELSTLLNGITDDPKNELRRRLIVVAGESAALAGWWAYDAGDVTAAHHLYKTAERAAEEAEDPAITSCLLAYRSYAPSMKGAHGRARALLGDALEALPRSDSPTVEAWLAARYAEESAALEDARSALTSWRRAEEAFAVADPEDDRVFVRFFDQSRFSSCHISTFANIPGKLDEAEDIASGMISSVGQLDPKRVAIVLGDVATAHLRRGHNYEACRLAKDGLQAVRESEFATWLPKFDSIAKSVSPWRTKEPVRNFLEELALTKRQLASSLH